MDIEPNKVMRLFEISKMLTQSMESVKVLQTFVQAAKELIEFADAAFLFLYDEDKEVLLFVDGVGIKKEEMEQMVILPMESLTGMSYSKKKSMLSSRNIDIEAGMRSMSEKNLFHYRRAVYNKRPESSFCVPLIHGEKCLGVINVDSFQKNIEFVPMDMKILEIIADQCAISIINTNQMKLVKRQNLMLNKSINIHQQFTKLVLENKNEKDIILMLGKMLQCDVYYKEFFVEREGYNSFAITSKNENLGFIYYKRKDLLPLDVVALEHASTALALNIVRNNALYENEMNLRNELFQDIIGKISVDELNKIAIHLKWKLDWEYVCIIMEGKNKAMWNPKKLFEKKNFIKYVENRSKAICRQSFVLIKGLQIIIMTPVLTEGTPEKVIKLINEQLDDATSILYGIGRQISPLFSLSQSFEEAKHAVNFGKKNNDRNIIYYRHLGVQRLWQNVDYEILNNFIRDYLGPLLEMGKDYEDTLFELINSNKNHKKTAKILHIHVNTLYMRLKKIESQLNISLNNINDWHNLQSAYQIYKSLRKVPGST